MLAAFFMGNMREKDPFADVNPFLRLSNKSFRRDSLNTVSPAPGIKQKQEHACEIPQDEESRLFLQAVRALPLEKKTSCETIGFTANEDAFTLLQAFPAEAKKAALSCAAPSRQALLNPPAKTVLLASRQVQACDASYDAELFAADAHARDFARAMRDVRPLKNKGRDVPFDAEPPAVSAPQQPSFQELLETTLEFALNFSKEYVEGHVVGLESLILQKLRAGQYSPEAHLDLHGLNTRQAFDALVGFVRRSWHRNIRALLLIPGRGKNSPDGVAVLRERVQSWLTQDPLKRVVLAFCTAKPADGGSGSLYVLLRKYKKRGKVYWERCPADLDL
jgi:DNA-nicking Smr family endonuclease